jgi:twinkle protein
MEGALRVNVIPDTVDLERYLRAPNDVRVQVRSASSFAEQLQAEFAPRPQGRPKVQMLSTKLRGVLEYRRGEVTAMAGYNGQRKSMFGGQIVLDLATQHQRVLLASFEMTPARSLARMARQACGIESPSSQQLRQFSTWTDSRVWMFDHLGRITPERCLAVCRYFAEELKGQHVFLDSMMMICASEEHLDEQKQFMTDLVRLAVETGLHIHLIAHCRKPPSGGEDKAPTKYDLRGSAAISDQAHNVIIVWSNRTKKARGSDPGNLTAGAEPDAVISVEKQRNGQFEGKVALWFDEASLRFCDDRTSAVEPYAMGAA